MRYLRGKQLADSRTVGSKRTPQGVKSRIASPNRLLDSWAQMPICSTAKHRITKANAHRITPAPFYKRKQPVHLWQMNGLWTIYEN